MYFRSFQGSHAYWALFGGLQRWQDALFTIEMSTDRRDRLSEDNVLEADRARDPDALSTHFVDGIIEIDGSFHRSSHDVV